MAYKVTYDATPSNVLPGKPAGAALSAGELVYLDSSGYWQKADQVANTSTSRTDALGVVVNDAIQYEVINPVRIAVIKGFSGLTTGVKQYLSDTAGAFTESEPTTNIRQVCGVAVAADTILAAIGGAAGAPVDVGGDANADSLALASTLSVGTNAGIGGTLHVTGAVTMASTMAITGAVTLSGGIADATNVALGTTTGTKLGTAATQKLGFWNATPVVQPSSASQAVVTPTVTATPTTAAIATDLAAVIVLANQIRAELVEIGAIKGSA